MNVKGFGIFLLCVPVLGAAAAYLDRLRARCAALEALAGFFAALGEEDRAALPLPERLSRAGRPYAVLQPLLKADPARPLPEVWLENADAFAERCRLTRRERQRLREFSGALSAVTEAAFTGTARADAACFGNAALEAGEERRSRTRTVLSFGVLGVFLALIVAV